jgi:hypothetical protein
MDQDEMTRTIGEFLETHYPTVPIAVLVADGRDLFIVSKLPVEIVRQMAAAAGNITEPNATFSHKISRQ